MSVGRYNARRAMVVEEANGIGTTWLRASLLPGEHPAPVKELLRRYVEVRLQTREVSDDPIKLAEGLRASAEIEKALWGHAKAARPGFRVGCSDSVKHDRVRLDLSGLLPVGHIYLSRVSVETPSHLAASLNVLNIAHFSGE